jgi:3-dehydroquinate synthase
MTDGRNLILTGFMGTGKTSVGGRVARMLGRPFLDMDAEIVDRQGHTIPEIFEQLGEAAFRAIEAGLCQDLSAREGLVIATGGGCLVDDANRETLSSSGLVVCLDCEPDGIVQRLRGGEGRPMLRGDALATRVHDLLARRRKAYARIPYHIDTTHRTVDRVAEAVVRLYRAGPEMWTVRTPGGSYPLHLIPGGLAFVGDQLRMRGVVGDPVVVSDTHVWPRWGAPVVDGLEACGYHPTPVAIAPGEEHKTLATVATLYDSFAAAGLDRSGAVIAVGGGVVTDMAGFAAATYMRGVPLVPVPTTLLGMVDASVGGKVAVDLPQGKNLVGAFVEPLFVILDTDVLATLPEIETQAGLTEIIKAGVIADPALFEALEGGERPPLRWLLARALRVKIDVVQEDPYEHGRRAVLNLGHTFAHAYEVLAGYNLHHGLAVSMGMVRAAMLAEARGLCTAETRARITATLRRHGLPVVPPAQDPELVYDAMHADKKKRGGRLRFVLPRAIGDVAVVDDVTADEVIEVLRRDTP